MAVKLVLNGVDDLKYALRMLPEELADDGGDIVRFWSQQAAGAARASYPRGRTGNLQNKVVVEQDASGFSSRYGVRYRVRNKAPHAYLYEYGSQARHYTTKNGRVHGTGAMPAAPPGRAFVPHMMRARERMYAQLVSLVVGHGLAVRGDRGAMSRDSSDIDAALVAVLAGDAELATLLPDGVWFDEAPPDCRQFALVSLFHGNDEATFVRGRAIEDAVYLVKGVTFGTSGVTVKAAAARIDVLLENLDLVVAGFACMRVNREQRVRYPEVDDVDPSIRWQHRGGHYRVAMAVTD